MPTPIMNTQGIHSCIRRQIDMMIVRCWNKSFSYDWPNEKKAVYKITIARFRECRPSEYLRYKNLAFHHPAYKHVSKSTVLPIFCYHFKAAALTVQMLLKKNSKVIVLGCQRKLIKKVTSKLASWTQLKSLLSYCCLILPREILLINYIENCPKLLCQSGGKNSKHIFCKGMVFNNGYLYL